MCGRFTLRTPQKQLAEQLHLPSDLQLPLRFNVAPTQQVLAIRQATPPDDRLPNGYGFTLLRWGLVPSWAKDPNVGNRMINARSETVAEKPSFRYAFKNRRCLIIADGYYEWRSADGQKQPFYIHQTDFAPFAMAGLWEAWEPKRTEATSTGLETCTILTTSANRLTQSVHHRMPVILPPEDHDLWLSKATPPTNLIKLLKPAAEDVLAMYPVSKLVNSPRYDQPDCIESVELAE